MKISLYPPLSIHEIGQRTNQEDTIAQWDNRLFVLCDGMGGHEKGEVASQTVCQSLVKWFENNIKDNSFSDDLFLAALEQAYSELDTFDNVTLRKMGTTLTLLYIHSEGITAAHMGDSRIYHIRPNVGVLYQSRDHSLVFDLFQSGEISYDEMQNFAQKNIVTRAMTPNEDNRMRPDIIHITDIQPGDYFYMCSDGMLESLSKKELISIFSTDETDIEIKNTLTERTKDSQDNHSAWILHVKGVTKEHADLALSNEELTARCNVVVSLPEFANEDGDVVLINEEKPTLFQKIKSIFR